MCACVSVRVWRAPEPCSLSESRRRERTEEAAAAAARSSGPRDEAPTCPQLPGPAGELIGHPAGSGIRDPRDAALSSRAPAPPARPHRAPGKEFAWPSLRLSAQVAGARGDPPRGKTSGEGGGFGREEATPGSRGSPYLFHCALSQAERGGRGRRRKRRRRGWGGRTGYKDRLGGWWKIFGLFSSVFS